MLVNIIFMMIMMMIRMMMMRIAPPCAIGNFQGHIPGAVAVQYNSPV